MSDSAKLRFVYGLICYILSLFDLAAILVLSLLVGFKTISEEFLALIFILVIFLFTLFCSTIHFFTKLYYIGEVKGKYEK